MFRWNELPTEVLSIIFKNLKNKNDILRQCALTCRSWKFVVQPILFSEIRIGTEQHLRNLVLVLIENPTLRSHAKYLGLNYGEGSVTELEFLSALFPNIRNYCYSKSAKDGHDNFCKAVYKGVFPHIDVIPIPREDHWEEEYLECLEKRKNTVSNICFRGLGTKFERLRDRLDEFPLRHINILFEKPSSTSIMDYIELMTQKSKLPLLERVYVEITMVENGNLSTNLDDVQPLPTVKCLKMLFPWLEGKKPIINDTFMLYIMKKFPGLTEFYILQIEDGLSTFVIRTDRIIPFASKLLFQFLYCRPKIDNSFAQFIITKKSDVNMVKNVRSSFFNAGLFNYPHLKISCDSNDNMEMSTDTFSTKNHM